MSSFHWEAIHCAFKLHHFVEIIERRGKENMLSAT